MENIKLLGIILQIIYWPLLFYSLHKNRPNDKDDFITAHYKEGNYDAWLFSLFYGIYGLYLMVFLWLT